MNLTLPSINELFPELKHLFRKNLNKRNRKPPGLVDRKFRCDYEFCTKAYGSLHHLNTHKRIKSHGKKLKLKELKFK